MVGSKIIALSISGLSLAVVAIPQPSTGESATLDTRRARAARTSYALQPQQRDRARPFLGVGFLAPQTSKAFHGPGAHGDGPCFTRRGPLVRSQYRPPSKSETCALLANRF